MVENMKVITLARNQVFQTVKDMLSENGGERGSYRHRRQRGTKRLVER